MLHEMRGHLAVYMSRLRDILGGFFLRTVQPASLGDLRWVSRYFLGVVA